MLALISKFMDIYRPITVGVEHIKVTRGGVTVDPEFWIGAFYRDQA